MLIVLIVSRVLLPLLMDLRFNPFVGVMRWFCAYFTTNVAESVI